MDALSRADGTNEAAEPASAGHAVVIAGGGPTGMMLAGELALAGVDVVIVERRTDQSVDGSRAGGLHSRSIEVLDQRGIAERFLTAGYTVPGLAFSSNVLSLGDFPSRHNYVLALWQSLFEPILADWVAELGVPTVRGCDVSGFVQDDDGVDVALSDGRSIRAEYLVGCDGGRSVVRKAAGIEFGGLAPSTSWMIAEVVMDATPQLGFHRDSVGTHAIGPASDGTSFRVVLTERDVEHAAAPTIGDLREALLGIYGTDFGLRIATWISRFTDMTRQAVSYRNGRVLLAGDAAHVHPPQGGQGLNIGVQDAVNLGWKLAQVVSGVSPDSLLDTYHAERHPVGAMVLHNTRAQVALAGADERHQALRELMSRLVTMDEPRRSIAAMLSGLDVHYDLGEGHPLLGRRMPDLDLHLVDAPRAARDLAADRAPDVEVGPGVEVAPGVAAVTGPTRLFTLLHDARPVLLNLGRPGGFDGGPWAGRVRCIDATYDGVWELPVIGEVAAPMAVLIRPDGYVAWVGELGDPQLPVALTTWFGQPSR